MLHVSFFGETWGICGRLLRRLQASGFSAGWKLAHNQHHCREEGQTSADPIAQGISRPHRSVAQLDPAAVPLALI
jgi:hypothetical protein